MRHAPLLAVLVVLGCHRGESAEPEKKTGAPPPPIKVETAAVEIRKMPRYLTLTGSVIADRQADVAANVVGRVRQAPIERGQAVREGQVLVVVDSRAANLSASAAAAQLRVVESQQRLAQSDCTRAESLYARGAMSKAEYDRVQAQCNVQSASESAARANSDLASKQLGDTMIRAPFDGIVGERFVNPGEYVLAQTRVASVYRINPVRVQISVPETATRLIRQDETLNVRVAAWGERDFPAVIRHVAPALRPQTRDLIVEAVVKNDDSALRPGMFAVVQLLVGDEDQPTVPAAAVKTEGMSQRIFLLRGGQAWEMVVRTGAARDGQVAILEPLPSGQKVIVRPPPGLQDGSAVQ